MSAERGEYSMSPKIKGVIVFTTFVGAASVCAILSATYPIAIWGVGYAVLQRRKQPQHVCPLVQYSKEVKLRAVD